MYRLNGHDQRVWNDALQCAALALARESDPLRPDALIDGDPGALDCSRERTIKMVLALKR